MIKCMEKLYWLCYTKEQKRDAWDTVDGRSLQKEVMSMYITLEQLLAFSMFVIALIALIVKIKR